MLIDGECVPWTEEEKIIAIRMKRNKRTYAEIREKLPRRTNQAIRGLFARGGWHPPRGPVSASKIVPEKVLQDRDRRLNEPRDLTAILMGDPPRSQSALYKQG